MDLTDPFVGMVPRKMSDAELARAIRLNIAAEIDAINLYAAHMEATENQQARTILAHIIDEEKEHLAEFLELLKVLDPKQAEELNEAPGKVQEILAGQHSVEASPNIEPTPVESALNPVAGRASTVGTLRPGRS